MVGKISEIILLIIDFVLIIISAILLADMFILKKRKRK